MLSVRNVKSMLRRVPAIILVQSCLFIICLIARQELAGSSHCSDRFILVPGSRSGAPFAFTGFEPGQCLDGTLPSELVQTLPQNSLRPLDGKVLIDEEYLVKLSLNVRVAISFGLEAYRLNLRGSS